MADVNEVVATGNESQAQATTAPELPQEVRDMMEISLNGGVPKNLQSQEPVVPSNEATVVAESVKEPVQQPITADPFGVFKERFGYQTPEDAMKEIEELRAIKANPSAEIEFENEQSKQVFELLKAGKTKDVYAVLAQQERLESLVGLDVNKDNAADIIKFGMQLKHQELNADEVEFKFNERFAYPKEPVQGLAEPDDEFATRKSEWQDAVKRIDMSKVIEAKSMKPELQAAKANIKLPEIENSVDEQYAQWLKSLEDAPKVDAETKEAYKAFTPQSIKTKLDFNDEANKIALSFEFEPDAESFEIVRQLVSDGDLFWKSYQGQDGKPDRERFLRDLYYGRNIQKVLTEAIKQAKNATIKAQLPDNNSGGMNRQAAQNQEPSELEKQMQQSLYPFQRR